MTTNSSSSLRRHSRDHGNGNGTAYSIRRRTSVSSMSLVWVALAVICHWQVLGVNGQTTAPSGEIGGSATLSDMFDMNMTLSPNMTMPPSNMTMAPSPSVPIPPEESAPPTTSGSLPLPITTPLPTVAATTMPPTMATAAPTVMTAEPTVGTAEPTVGTAEPTTLAPSFMPTPGPTTITTQAPTDLTASPTVFVTAAPNTTAPVATPGPTNATESPTMFTTMEPTIMNSSFNTSAPTSNMTSSPSVSPSLAPTEFNTMAPSFNPTSLPTSPAGTPVSETLENLEMTLEGLNQIMSPDMILDWKAVTEEHIQTYFTENPGLSITNVETIVTLQFQNVTTPTSRLLRHDERELQTASVQATYSQVISYQTRDASRDTPEMIAAAPFSTAQSQDAYVVALQDANNDFAGVTGVSEISQGSGGGGGSNPIIPPEDDGGGLSTGAIVGIVVGCVVGVFAILGIGYFVSQRGDDGGYVSTGKTPPSQLDVGGGLMGDEVSTLAEPHTNNRASGISNVMSGESGVGYGDQSVATVDYDYSKAYGGGGDTSVSSAGGTFGSQTHANAAGGATVGASTLGTNGNGAHDPSYPDGGPQFRGSSANVREELVDIYAPPGKLGVVIDTPDDGAPVVHAVKDSSVIADKLQVGDKLVAVDDEDVRSMTAIKVSKLISRKSANASRKLSIIRTVVIDE